MWREQWQGLHPLGAPPSISAALPPSPCGHSSLPFPLFSRALITTPKTAPLTSLLHFARVRGTGGQELVSWVLMPCTGRPLLAQLGTATAPEGAGSLGPALPSLVSSFLPPFLKTVTVPTLKILPFSYSSLALEVLSEHSFPFWLYLESPFPPRPLLPPFPLPQPFTGWGWGPPCSSLPLPERCPSVLHKCSPLMLLSSDDTPMC